MSDPDGIRTREARARLGSRHDTGSSGTRRPFDRLRRYDVVQRAAK